MHQLRADLRKFEESTGLTATELSNDDTTLVASRKTVEEADALAADNHDLLVSNNALQTKIIEMVCFGWHSVSAKIAVRCAGCHRNFGETLTTCTHDCHSVKNLRKSTLCFKRSAANWQLKTKRLSLEAETWRRKYKDSLQRWS